MTERKESGEYTLYVDLDGMTVADLRRMLDDYPDDARVDVRSEKIYDRGGWTYEGVIVIRWEE